MRAIGRRRFLTAAASAAGTGLICSAVGAPRAAAQARITAPTIDSLAVRVVLDGGHDIFIETRQMPGVKVERTGNPGGAQLGKALHSQWGLSLYLESTIGTDTKRHMLDYGYTSDALINNLEMLKVDVARVDSLIVSHGHFDHYGGLSGFLDKYRAAMRPEMTLYCGGEDNFCYRYNRTPDGQFASFGVLDRRELERHRLKTVLCHTPTVIDGHAFTTGTIARSGFERILPNTWEEAGQHDGAGCDAGHFTAAERQGKIVPDQHYHEHATCFNLKDRGLVVITSCGHVGLINTVRQAQAVTGISKVHAVLGGFHLGPAPAPYVAEAVAAVKALDPDIVIPMHCSGTNFIAAAREQMPDKLLVSTVGSRFTFGV
jgi:7,8-dihydropterin-6-yl-methyl-4-(beta-D-ribofuranosyl)aminobenzene 5'-phosphate synthase